MKTAILLLITLLVLPCLAIAEPVTAENINYTGRNNIVVEIALFSAKPGVAAETVIDASKAMETTITGWQGFIRRELVELGEGRWVDIVHWQDMAAAKNAEIKALKSSSCLNFFALLDETQGQMLHGSSRLIQGAAIQKASRALSSNLFLPTKRDSK